MRSLLRRSVLFLSQKKGVEKTAVRYAFGDYTSKIITAFSFPIIASNMGFENTGKYDLILTSCIIAAPVFTLHISDAIYRWLTDTNSFEQKKGYSNGLAFLMAVLIFIIGTFPITNLFYSSTLLLPAYCLLISLIIYRACQQVIRGLGLINKYAIASIFNALTYASIALVGLILLKKDLPFVLFAMTLGNLLASVLLIIPITKRRIWSPSTIGVDQMFSLIKFSFPLLVNSLGWMLVIQLNKYVIAYFFGNDENGIYAITERLASPIYLLAFYYYFSTQDHFLKSSEVRRDSSFLFKIIKKLVLISGIGTIILQLLYMVFLPHFFPDLTVVLRYIPAMAVANILLAITTFLGIPYIQSKDSNILARTTLYGLVIMALTTAISINLLGLYGVYLSISLGTLLTIVMRLKYTKHYYLISL
ncbi:lipopolysaccharide biosynthesis protein [Roseivirga pacifica]